MIGYLIICLVPFLILAAFLATLALCAAASVFFRCRPNKSGPLSIRLAARLLALPDVFVYKHEAGEKSTAQPMSNKAPARITLSGFALRVYSAVRGNPVVLMDDDAKQLAQRCYTGTS